MSTPTVSAIATALGAALGSVPNLRTVPYLPDTFTPPVAVIGIDKVNYHGAFSDADVEHTFTVYVIVSRANDRSGIATLEGFMSQAGTSSIRAAIEADPTLAGVVSTLIVEESGPPAAITVADGAVYTSVPFTVTVHA